MPSPIAHLTAGYIIYRLARGFAPQADVPADSAAQGNGTTDARGLFLTATAFSMLPDVDSLAGLLAGNFGRYHNNITHSFLVGAALSLGFAGALSWRRRGFWLWFLVALSGYSLHVLMDGATVGRGVMALWPMAGRRYSLPVALFYGFHWSDGWVSVRHLWTAATELIFTGVTVALFWLLRPVRRRR